MAYATNLIDGGFDRFQTALEPRFKGLGFKYNYGNLEGTPYLEVQFKKDGASAEAVYYKTGMLDFDFICDEITISESFRKITDDEFHLLLGFIYAYYSEGCFERHQKWFDDLKNFKSI